MSQTTENTYHKCNPAKVFKKLVTAYDLEQVHNAFTDVDTMLKDWLHTENADQTKTRQQFLFSAQIIQELGLIVKAIPQSMIDGLVGDMEEPTLKKQ